MAVAKYIFGLNIFTTIISIIKKMLFSCFAKNSGATILMHISFLSGIILSAKNKITGTITDTNGSPLFDISVLIKNVHAATIIKGGKFRIIGSERQDPDRSGLIGKLKINFR